MRLSRIVSCLLALGLFCAVTPSTTVLAGELIVNNSTTATCSSSATPPCYQTINAAIAEANNLYTADSNSTSVITVETGTYPESITLLPGVTLLRGTETARTVLSGGGSQTILSTNNVGATIRNFTFVSAPLGISVSGSAAVTITNNVFVVGSSGTGVQISTAPSTNITNNVFFLNGVALSTNSDVPITNNIFSNNTANIQVVSGTATNITYNDFNPQDTTGAIGSNSIPNITVTDPDPLFVNPNNLDFHLQTGSPCINAGSSGISDSDGTTSDMGAYGGPNADTIPLQVGGVTLTTPASDSVTLSWNANKDYRVAGYRIYYGTASGIYNGTNATAGPSPLKVSSGVTTTTLSGFTGASGTITAPTLTQDDLQPQDGKLLLSWPSVSGATSYTVYYGTTSPPTETLPGITATTTPIKGLTNGQTYYVAVQAVAQKNYYFSITAADSTGLQSGSPGVSHESTYSSVVSETVGSAIESPLSTILHDFPEAGVTYPDLPNTRQGCFIATAAYGFYSAPQVQALRVFRNRYLLTNGPGKAFVHWYYTYGPIAADWLVRHPAWKPPVRAALLPLIGLSLFLTRTGPWVHLATLVLGILLVVFALGRRRLLRKAGGAS